MHERNQKMYLKKNAVDLKSTIMSQMHTDAENRNISKKMELMEGELRVKNDIM